MKIIIEIMDGEIKIISHTEAKSASPGSYNDSVHDASEFTDGGKLEIIDTGPARLNKDGNSGGNDADNAFAIGSFSGDVSAGPAPKIE